MPNANECPRCGAEWKRNDSPLVLLNLWACGTREYSSPHTICQSGKCRIAELELALRKVLMVALLPNDVSGQRMVEDARDALHKKYPAIDPK